MKPKLVEHPLAPDPEGAKHIPVLLAEVLETLQVGPGGWFIDGTLGGGGHTAALLESSAPDGRVLGLDADPAAVRRADRQLSAAIADRRLLVVQARFDTLRAVAIDHRFQPVDGILLDLGLSTFQLDTPERGFSFTGAGPLDMRFDPSQGLSAADLVNTWPEVELAGLLYRFGDEKLSRQIARHLVARRPVKTTDQLCRLVQEAVGHRYERRIHPATRTFQALRIAVNDELGQLERALPQGLSLLKPGGRLAVISFHSLEDRIVKRWMRDEARAYVPEPTYPQGGYSRVPALRTVNRSPITPSEAELKRNPRSRSAKLRVAERIGSQEATSWSNENE
jgi:16S rRNA (cytosine1402-N4)-methyltransferase